MVRKQKSRQPKSSEKLPPLTVPPATIGWCGSKRFKRFYEPLVLQYALGQTRGPHTSSAPVDTQYEEGGDHNIRRLLVDSLAYFCDYEKGGGTVTAIALETTPTGRVIFWVAANKLNAKVVPFLRQILNSLAGLDPNADHSALEERIFEQAVEFGKHRVDTYRRFMELALNECIKVLDESQGESDKDLAARLKQFRRKGDDMQDMLDHCRLCYSETIARNVVDSLKKWTPKPYHTANDEGNASNFLDVRHTIGRLARHRKAAKAIVTAAARFPALFDDYEIQTCPSSGKAETSPTMAKNATLDGMVIRMLPMDDPRVESIQSSLHQMDTKLNIFECIQQVYSRRDFRPIVHAELILLEHLHNKEYMPIGERYIGCSKPACYCCYHYICAHPGRFIRPASHHKIYLNWRPPDVIDDDAGLAAKRRDVILDTMLLEIRRDTCSQIEEQRVKYPFHNDTTTGITSLASIILDDNPVTSPTETNVDGDEGPSGDDSGMAEQGSEDEQGSEGEPGEVIFLNKGSFL